jgi:hypothetical protein
LQAALRDEPTEGEAGLLIRAVKVNRAKVRDIPWQLAVVLAAIAAGLIALVGLFVSAAEVRVPVILGIGAAYFVGLRRLMVREQRLFPHGRPRR